MILNHPHFLTTKEYLMSNEIMIITPYKHEQLWVFDDESKGIEKEPFVAGADNMLDIISDYVNGNKFSLLFSNTPFPNYDYMLEHRKQEYEGNWYWSEYFEIECWLCAKLLDYFETAPKNIYIQVKNDR